MAFEEEKIEGTQLAFHTYDWPHECDGCAKEIPAGTKVVGNITSCCGGGCTRSICMDCVNAIVVATRSKS